MQIYLERIYTCSTYTIGHLYINGEYICDTIEDTDRGLDKSMDLKYLLDKKVYAETAIPLGVYRVTLDIKSPKFSKKDYYKQFCNGYLPRLLNVPAFDGILMHKGSTARSSAGCIILGYNTIKGAVTDSQKAFEKVYNKLKNADDPITILISAKYKK